MLAAFLPLSAAHELGHVAACAVAGVPVPELGVTVRYGQLSVYCDISHVQFAARPKRWLVYAGGIYVESLIWTASVFAWAAADGTWTRAVWFVIMTTATIRIVFSLLPVPGFDGYQLISDASGIRALDVRSWSAVVLLLRPNSARSSQPTTLLKRAGLAAYAGIAGVAHIARLLLFVFLVRQCFLLVWPDGGTISWLVVIVLIAVVAAARQFGRAHSKGRLREHAI
jgi:hypothetical protein